MKVLVVEDSSSMRAYLTTILESGSESYDLEIVEAASGFEALKTLPHHKFDAILTDINMPDINGLELVSFLKNRSEEHTSELQSPYDLVCRLLLEKKKKNTQL